MSIFLSFQAKNTECFWFFIQCIRTCSTFLCIHSIIFPLWIMEGKSLSSICGLISIANYQRVRTETTIKSPWILPGAALALMGLPQTWAYSGWPWQVWRHRTLRQRKKTAGCRRLPTSLQLGVMHATWFAYCVIFSFDSHDQIVSAVADWVVLI